jgi:fructokinase
VKVAETTGAGDGFVAALLSGLLAHVRKPDGIAETPPERLAQICDFANAVGALTCTKVGAIPALPARAAALRFWNARRTTPAR